MISFRKLISRVNSISTPIGGFSWEADKNERDVAQSIIFFLEDRRFLYSPFEHEDYGWVVDSVLEARKQLSDALANDSVNDSSVLGFCLISMRAACRVFLSKISQKQGRPVETGFEFILALGELRAQLGASLLQVSVAYEIDLPDAIEGVLPPQLSSQDKREKSTV